MQSDLQKPKRTELHRIWKCVYASVLPLDKIWLRSTSRNHVESLYVMWTVSPPGAVSVEECKRCERQCWRICHKNLPYDPSHPKLAIVPVTPPFSQPSSKGTPELSASIDTITSINPDDSQRNATSLLISESRSPPKLRYLVLGSSSGHDKPLITSKHGEVVICIQEQPELESLSASTIPSQPKIADMVPRPIVPSAWSGISVQNLELDLLQSLREPNNTVSPETNTRKSDYKRFDRTISSDRVGALIRSGSVVYGFNPVERSKTTRSWPDLIAMRKKTRERPEQSPTFTLGGSSSDDESLLDDQTDLKSGRIGLSKGLGRDVLLNQQRLSVLDLFKAHLQEKIEEGSCAMTDDDAHEEAIAVVDDEGEGDGEWEDVSSDNERPTVIDKRLFQRVKFQPNLISRRSTLTTILHEQGRAAALPNAASCPQFMSHSFNHQSRPAPRPLTSAQENDDQLRQNLNAPHRARPCAVIMTASNDHASSHSPGTRRGMMLSTELTKTLRKNMLRERQQNHVRRHTLPGDHSVSGQGHDIGDAAKNFWSNCFDTASDYYQTGW